MKRIKYIFLIVTICSVVACNFSSKEEDEDNQINEVTLLYGIDPTDYNVVKHEVAQGDTWGAILNSYNVTQQTINRLDALSKDICPLRSIRFGDNYTTFIKGDSITSHLDYLVYEHNIREYVVFSFVGDSVAVNKTEREVSIVHQKKSVTIDSSLWGAIMKENLPYELAADMEDIYQWTVDFFGIQAGDNFTVIYDEELIDSQSIGIAKICAAKFNHNGKEIYAIPFEQGGELRYWEYDGGSLRKQLLKAPLKFTRISSKFTNARYHPVLHRYMPHHGVDYAAPSGTPVHSVADGVVIDKGYKGAGGNMIKIKHPNKFTSGYMHLRGFAKGIAKGSKVRQGQLIGYVGSTGRSTGPHLDFRLWKGSTPINPLKVPQLPTEPISSANRAAFEAVRDSLVMELK